MKRQRQKKRFIGVVFVSTVGFVLALLAYRFTVNAPVFQGEDGYSLYVRDTGSTVEEVFQPLMDQALVPHPRWFKVLLALKGNPQARRRPLHPSWGGGHAASDPNAPIRL